MKPGGSAPRTMQATSASASNALVVRLDMKPLRRMLTPIDRESRLGNATHWLGE
jgi:hypothetical protein